MRPGTFFLAIGIALLMAGCSFFRPDRSCHKEQPYESSTSIARLKVPAGMDAPDTRDALVVPQVGEPEAPRSRSDACLDEPPRYRTETAADTGAAGDPTDEKRDKKKKKKK